MTEDEIKILSEQLDAAIRSTDFWTLIRQGIEVVASWEKEGDDAETD